MPNLEQLPPPTQEQEPASVSESKSERTKGVMTRLAKHISEWRETYGLGVIAGVALNLAIVTGKFVIEREQARKTAAEKAAREVPPPSIEDIQIPEGNLRSLDEEASPERLRSILATYPKGFAAGEITMLVFRDEEMPMPETYGTGGEQEAHVEGTEGEAGESIEFFRGARGQSSYELWADTLAHEAGHTGDWIRSADLTAEDRQDFNRRVRARVLDADRYESGYVESISNEDQEKELETKAVEYWAEIFSAYLRGDVLQADDKDLVEWVISRTDPDYDFKSNLARRNAIIAEMGLENAMARLYELEPEKAEELRAWLGSQRRAGFEATDAVRRREGREELVEILREWATTPERQAYASELLETYRHRDDLEADLEKGDARRIPEDVRIWFSDDENLSKHEQESGDRAELLAFRARFEAIVSAKGVVFGYQRDGTMLEPGELERLGFDFDSYTEDAPKDEWIFRVCGWNRSEDDYSYKEEVVGDDILLRWISYAK